MAPSAHVHQLTAGIEGNLHRPAKRTSSFLNKGAKSVHELRVRPASGSVG